VLPNQRGVLVHGDRQVREVGPGRIWVRPGRKLLLCDVRPRKLQIEGFDLLTSDGAVLRSSVGGQYSISNAMTFLSASGNAGDALYFDLRRLLTTVAREHSSFAITSAREVFIQQVKDRLNRAVAPTGLEVSQLECWDLVQRGWMQHPGEPVIDGGMVH
jgi:regulator of protease activity HflC (stomatin/prohibitin superfamily)